MRLDEAREMALRLMTRHGLLAAGWKFKFNGSKTLAGRCGAFPGQPGVVEVSRHFALLNDPADVLQTVLHEVAHALAGPEKGHGPDWVAACLKVGARPDRLCGSHVKIPEGKWRGQCPNCKRVFHRHRRPKVLQGWSCKACGPVAGRFDYEKA
jgi:hypothetical protein